MFFTIVSIWTHNGRLYIWCKDLDKYNPSLYIWYKALDIPKSIKWQVKSTITVQVGHPATLHLPQEFLPRERWFHCIFYLHNEIIHELILVSLLKMTQELPLNHHWTSKKQCNFKLLHRDGANYMTKLCIHYHYF